MHTLQKYFQDWRPKIYLICCLVVVSCSIGIVGKLVECKYREFGVGYKSKPFYILSVGNSLASDSSCLYIEMKDQFQLFLQIINDTLFSVSIIVI